MLCSGQLTKGNSKMVGIVEGIEKIFVERVDILKTWESIEDQRELLGEGLLGELDLTGIEIWEISAQ